MDNNQLWVLRNSKSGQEIRLVGNASMLAFLQSLPENERDKWVVQMQEAEVETNPPPPPLVEEREKTKSRIVAVPVLPPLPKKKIPAEARKHKRMDLHLRVMLIFGDKLFRTHSKNISQGGILLSDAVPSDFNEKDCVIVLQSPHRNENIELPFSFVGQLADRKRIQFGESEQVHRIIEWLGNAQPKAA